MINEFYIIFAISKQCASIGRLPKHSNFKNFY